MNADRVNRKLPSLLIDGNTTIKKLGCKAKSCIWFGAAKETQTVRVFRLEAKLLAVLNELEKAVTK